MPANLPPDYHRAEERYRAAKTTEEKIEALEEMLRIMPKHKGTDGLQGDVKARIAKLRKQPAKKAARASFSHVIPREGAGQVALVGPPNTGKSSLVTRLTHATPEVAEYPFTTREPTPGMMPFEDIAFQLVDLPPLSTEQHVEPWVFDLVRRADLLWIVVHVENGLDEMEEAKRTLEARNIGFYPAGSSPPREDASVQVSRKGLLVVTGLDRPGAAEDVEVLNELLPGPWPLVSVSCRTGQGLEDLKRKTFEAMEILRVYTKQPGKPPDRRAPFTLSRRATVGDLAAKIHKDLLQNLKFARVWGKSAFDGQTVQREHVLQEGDVVELHT